MTDILIKSFNRPYYLDRCLTSIYQFVNGDFKITVLDDGTPEKYLNKIKKKFPEVEIRLSKQYPQKIKAIQENLKSGKEIDGFQIPTKLWIDAVKNASDYVFVTEDDVWFTNPIQINDLVLEMKSFEMDLLKLGWLGNSKPKNRKGAKEISSTILSENLRGIFASNKLIMNLLINNKFKFFSILYRFGFVNNETIPKYWTLNSILMGLWKKEYWLYVWKDVKEKVNEKDQIRNAAVWLHKNKSKPNLIGQLKNNSLNTTFQSSATNSYHKYGHDFDVNYLNYLLNEAWINSNFDPMQNFPKDFSLEYIDQFLDSKIDKKEFHNWVETFKNQYRNSGFEID